MRKICEICCCHFRRYAHDLIEAELIYPRRDPHCESYQFKLRATTQLASVLAGQGYVQDGEPRLRAIIDAFDTKHEIVDLAAARKVLETLRR
jgi:hypothetical protein